MKYRDERYHRRSKIIQWIAGILLAAFWTGAIYLTILYTTT
jgi:hypothetical protein